MPVDDAENPYGVFETENGELRPEYLRAIYLIESLTFQTYSTNAERDAFKAELAEMPEALQEAATDFLFFTHFDEETGLAKKHLTGACVRILMSFYPSITVEQIAENVGRSAAWVSRYIKAIGKSEVPKLYDYRRLNRRTPVTGTSEVIEFVASQIKKKPFERWTGSRVAALMAEQFGFQEVGERQGRVILSKALEINRRSGR